MKVIDIRFTSRREFAITEGCQPTNALFFLTRGEFVCKFEGGETLTAKENELFFFPDNVRFSRSVTREIEFYYIRFDSENEFVHEAGKLLVRDPERLRATIGYLKKACDEHMEEHVRNHFFADLLYQVKVDETPIPDGFLTTLRQYMVANLSRSVTLSDLARVANLSESGLIAKFSRLTGETPIRYLISLRVEKARAMLTETDLPVFEISERCGFCNPYFFSNTFKQHVGVSPREYRKRNPI